VTVTNRDGGTTSSSHLFSFWVDDVTLSIDGCRGADRRLVTASATGPAAYASMIGGQGLHLCYPGCSSRPLYAPLVENSAGRPYAARGCGDDTDGGLDSGLSTYVMT